jgi:hypothetical protein
MVAQPEVIRFIRQATRWRRLFRCSLAASNFPKRTSARIRLQSRAGQSCYLRVGSRRIDGVPLFDAGFTDDQGVRGNWVSLAAMQRSDCWKLGRSS